MIQVVIGKTNKVSGPEGYSAMISFPYDASLVATIRNLPERWWHNDTKNWEIPLVSLPIVLDVVNGKQEIDISGHYVELPKLSTDIPENFKFKTTPFEHQLQGMKYGLSHNSFLLGDEQGLGKTKQVIDIAVAKKLQKGYKHCLIICGVNGLKWNWVNEVHTHSNEEAYILGQRTKKRSNKLYIGSTKNKMEDIKSLDKISAYFIITNVETLRDSKIADELQKRCADKTIGIVAIDEIHKCKQPSSQQGKGILKLKPEVRIAMTGTPLMNQPFDLYIILKWLGYEGRSFYSFQHHYGVFGGFGGYELEQYKNLDELQSNLDRIMIRRLKKDVLDLPEKLYIDEYVEMSEKQQQIYNEATAEVLLNIDKVKANPNPLASLIRLRQATGYTGILSTTIHESAKLDRMEELVQESVENGKKVVIFSNWTQITDQAINRLRKYHPAIITGDVVDEIRQQEADRFQTDPKCKVIIGTTGAMGTGLTLTAGTVEIFLDEPWNRALKDQAVDRCHRVGTTENVTIYTLLTKNTIDERIHELVEQKGKMSDILVDGKTKIDKGTLVDFLLS